jgi:hypothetical protein
MSVFCLVIFVFLFVNVYIVDHQNLGLLLPSLNIIRGSTGIPSVTIIVSAGSGCRALDGKKRGITWRLKASLEDMEYADDVYLVSQRYEHVQRKFDDLWAESKKAGLEINFFKTDEIHVITTVTKTVNQQIIRFLLLG